MSKHKPLILFIIYLFLGKGSVLAAMSYPDTIQPGDARIQVEQQHITVHNNLLFLYLSTHDNRLRPVRIQDKRAGQTLDLQTGELFRITTGLDPNDFGCSDFVVSGEIEVVSLQGDPEQSTAAQRCDGIQVKVMLLSPDKIFSVDWCIELRDGSNYFRQFVLIKPTKNPVVIQSIEFNGFELESVSVAGQVSGSPPGCGPFLSGI